MKRPAFQFYPGDWRKDVELRSCSIAARGLWIDIMCIAHDCEPYGFLMVNGRPMTAAKIAGQVGLTESQCRKLVDELIANGVARVNAEGVIYSKRMVDDEALRNRRAEGGKAGSEFGQLGADHGIKGGRPKAPKGDKETPLETPLGGVEKPPPSSSSSSSLLTTFGERAEPAALADKPPTDPPRPPMSPDEIIFGYGVPLLVNAGTADKQARSFLGKLRKAHGDDTVVNTLRQCLRAKPLQPLEWLAKALPPAVQAAPEEVERKRRQAENDKAMAMLNGHNDAEVFDGTARVL